MAQSATRGMYTLLVEMRCQSYCLFCGVREVDEALVRTRRRLGLSMPPTEYGGTRGRYTLESAAEALRVARRDGYTDLSLQGGEPTVFADLPALIAVARELDFRFIGVVTNGRKLANREYTRALLEAGLHGVTVSLLGGDAETHDKIAAAPGAFDGLVAGLGHAGELVRELGLPVKINANVIVTAPSVDQLPAQVRLLARLGVHAASLRLVRFNGLAADPIVRGMLRFDLERIRAPLAEAMAEARRLGLSLHATDIPICLHPRPTPGALERLAAHGTITHHRYEAAAFGYDIDSDTVVPRLEACEGCLVERSCKRAPGEYLPAVPGNVLRPLGEGSVSAMVDDTLAALDPRVPGAAASLAELAATVDLLGRARGAPLAAAARVAEALADLLVLAAQRRDADEAMGALCGLLGLRSLTGFRIPPSTWRLVELPAGALARQLRASAAPRGELRLRIGTFTLAIDADRTDDGTLSVRSIAPVLDRAATPQAHVARALFFGVLAPPLQSVRRLRVRPDGLDVDEGQGWRPILSAFRPDAITCVEAPRAAGTDDAAARPC